MRFVDVFHVSSTFPSIDLARTVHEFAAKEVSKKEATEESGRGGAEKRSSSRPYLRRLVRGLISEKKKNFGKQQFRLSRGEMGECRQG